MVNAPTRTGTLKALLDATVVGVVRAKTAEQADQIARGLLQGGLRAVEITANTPECFDLLASLREEARAHDAVLGAGTVRKVEEVEAAVDAGVSFIVSPHTDVEIIRAGRAANLVVIPGALTPTEILTAHGAGADVVKVFPVEAVGGLDYLHWIRGPLPDVRLWVSGDVAVADIEQYLAAGASLIGLTSALTANLPDDLRFGAASRAREAIEACRQARAP